MTASSHPEAAGSRRRSVCVYCGARSGFDPRYAEAAQALGRALARRGLGLVYGGGRVGLMGVLADAALAGGGHVVGVIPKALVEREVAHATLSECIVTPSMHTRKAAMAERADAFLALPGGLGTLEELFEIWTWRQLGELHAPIGLLNVAGYYDPLLHFLDRSVQEGLLTEEPRGWLQVHTEPNALLDALLGPAAAASAVGPEALPGWL